MYSRNREELTIDGHQIIVERRIEHSQQRVSPLEFAMQHARGKLPSMYRDTEEEMISVYYKNRLLGNIRKAANGMYVYGSLSHRDSKRVIEMLVKRTFPKQ